ncbi:hypothetical protein BT69DRAFT_1307230 [Atractiella rhizophila]|nr:hypothetical protein BT69DRAFT_1307230 [Atractiella rhizophila]
MLCSHDESTFTANDGKKFGWYLHGQADLRKKGQGRGIHRSAFVSLTVGWMEDAGVGIEYGKNYEGYWNAAKLIAQVRDKFIPLFEKLHPGDQALIMFDNSTGHGAFAADALVVMRMNLGPGGSQCLLLTASLGMKVILSERGQWPVGGLKARCKKKADHNEDGTCCAEKLMALQPDFKSQKPEVAEVVETAGHLAIFLPKFHCKLFFIEFFWGTAKRYVRENCSYTFEGI